MAKSSYEYVKSFENSDIISPNVWIVVRIDGKCFHKFSEVHQFKKPNDKRCLDLMNKAALNVMKEIHDIIMAYGQSDEYSFVFKRHTKLYKRRLSKILTYVCSLFSVSFTFHWNAFFPDLSMKCLPSFDGRIVTYPTNKNLRDYLCWRQADCHINNLYNTAFWSLVQKKGLSPKEAEEILRDTDSAKKNELLYTQFNINYNNEPEQFKKGSFLLRKSINKTNVNVSKIDENPHGDSGVYVMFIDIIGNKLWKENSHILGNE